MSKRFLKKNNQFITVNEGKKSIDSVVSMDIFEPFRSDNPKTIIKFKNYELESLRTSLLKDLSKEQFAVLLGKYESIGDHKFIKIIETRFASLSDYHDQRHAFLRMKKEFIYDILVEIKKRYDVDTIVDVHTHPFSKEYTSFSGVDDSDESGFYRFIDEKLDNIHYASIVLSQQQYSARLWGKNEGKIIYETAIIKTQTAPESIPSCNVKGRKDSEIEKQAEKTSMFNRSVLALGLDNMRKIMNGQTITTIGVGGLGSVVAEHLIHMGFQSLNLVDNDVVEVSNLNRIVGAYYSDAVEEKSKVDTIKKHLESINPEAKIRSFCNDVSDPEIEEVIALSDWMILATDNHSSRSVAQRIAFKYFVPFISAGVNISINDGKITDMSGEAITVRMGDKHCLNCLKRINFIKVAQETHPEEEIREKLVKRGYVTGKDIKEPAVKTLNTNLATIAVDILINQYTGRQRTAPIVVYENNLFPVIYEDKESVKTRNLECYTCG